ncbi:MAG: PHP domain-containing protein, partial [Gammaproteobacteria bacterium]|nr:PHP domain-containing protein [Gammaproteobacteria bacterium]
MPSTLAEDNLYTVYLYSMSVPDYAELHTISNFTFLRGASHPEELVHTAARLGYRALALTDECSVAGVVRAHLAAREAGLLLIIGTEIYLSDGLGLVLLATDRASYNRIARLITKARRATEKGQYALTIHDIETSVTTDCLALLLPNNKPEESRGSTDYQRLTQHAEWAAAAFPGRVWLAAELSFNGSDHAALTRLIEIGKRVNVPLVAAGNVYMHHRSRKALQDTLTAIRLRITVHRAGKILHANAERCLQSRRRLQRLYPPALLRETLAIAERCRFSLDELKYQYPMAAVPEGMTATHHLRRLTEWGAQRRWPQGASQKVQNLIEHELGLIAELGYETYFLTVHNIMQFAKSQNIFCQGRGSAANSAVCFCLGITEVDPTQMDLLFERFISRERNEPPDIDIDFEHERREEVLQYIYDKYG